MTETTAERTARIEQYATDLVSGATFVRAAHAHGANRFSGGCHGPIMARQYGEVAMALGRFAREGDWHAAAAHRVLHALPLYGTATDLLAKVADALYRVASEGYDDVIGRSGPQPGRLSDHQHPTTVWQALLLSLLASEIEMIVEPSPYSIGWVTQALMEREGMTLPAYLFPTIVEVQKRSAENEARNSRR